VIRFEMKNRICRLGIRFGRNTFECWNKLVALAGLHAVFNYIYLEVAIDAF
jgi:hypothetical protein